jgi:TRAP-type C4-dicarboxylate transport system permease small subunit
LTHSLGGIAALTLFLLMIVTGVDVVGRYLFNQPLLGGFELTEVLLAALIFAGLPLVSLSSEHVTMDVLDSVSPPRLLRLQKRITNALGALCLSYLAWRLWLRAQAVAAAGETTAQLHFPLSALIVFMAAMIALSALAMLLATGPSSGDTGFDRDAT